jgi:hypothetical protein
MNFGNRSDGYSCTIHRQRRTRLYRCGIFVIHSWEMGSALSG